MKLLKSITIGISPLLAMSFSIAILLSSCAGADNRKSTRKVSTKVHDRKAYALGEEHAANLLKSADDEDSVQEGLLDIRARISNIEPNLGRQSAADYERGFTDYVRKNCDSHARIIF